MRILALLFASDLEGKPRAGVDLELAVVVDRNDAPAGRQQRDEKSNKRVALHRNLWFGLAGNMLYLHETIQIRGDGAKAYMAAVLERARHSEENNISRLVCTWQVIGSTARWPRVVNLWEMDGWQHWARALERQFDPALHDTHLATWWPAMLRYRRGGFDRILQPVPFSPSRAQLGSGGVRGWVTEQQIYRLRTEDLAPFFDEVRCSLVPLLQEYSLQLVGAYTVPMRPGEALVLWSAPRFIDLCRWWEEQPRVARWCAWQRRLEGWNAKQEIAWLVPFAGTCLSPLGSAP